MYALCIDSALDFGNALYLATSRSLPITARRAQRSVFEVLGGEAAMPGFVGRLHARIRADRRIAAWFYDTDLDGLTRFHGRFIAWLCGGAPSYPGRALAAAHGALARETGFGDAQFDALIDNLAATLAEFGINETRIEQIRVIAEGIRAEIHGLPRN